MLLGRVVSVIDQNENAADAAAAVLPLLPLLPPPSLLLLLLFYCCSVHQQPDPAHNHTPFLGQSSISPFGPCWDFNHCNNK